MNRSFHQLINQLTDSSVNTAPLQHCSWRFIF